MLFTSLCDCLNRVTASLSDQQTAIVRDFPIFVIVLVLLGHFGGVNNRPVVRIFKHPGGEANQESNKRVQQTKRTNLQLKNESYLEAVKPSER